jgi:hypothetical protein
MSAESADRRGGKGGLGHGAHRRQVKRAEHLAERIAHELSGSGADDAEIAKLARQLRPMLADLRRSALTEGGRPATLAAGGIADLSAAVKTLVKAQRAGTPGAALKQLAEGRRALESATAKARKAGDAWSL